MRVLFLSAGSLAAVFASSAWSTVAATQAVGTFRGDRAGRIRCEIQVAPVAHDTARVQLECTRQSPTYEAIEFDAHMPLTGDTARYEGQDFGAPCSLTFFFGRAAVRVSEREAREGACFGNEMPADGTFRRVGRKTPKFDAIAPD